MQTFVGFTNVDRKLKAQTVRLYFQLQEILCVRCLHNRLNGFFYRTVVRIYESLNSVSMLKGGQGREFWNAVSNLITALQISFVLPFLVSGMGRFYLHLVLSASHFTLACRHTHEKMRKRNQEQRQVINSFSIKFQQRHIP